MPRRVFPEYALLGAQVPPTPRNPQAGRGGAPGGGVGGLLGLQAQQGGSPFGGLMGLIQQKLWMDALKDAMGPIPGAAGAAGVNNTAMMYDPYLAMMNGGGGFGGFGSIGDPFALNGYFGGGGIGLGGGVGAGAGFGPGLGY